MELVREVKITDYCDEKRLCTRQNRPCVSCARAGNSRSMTPDGKAILLHRQSLKKQFPISNLPLGARRHDSEREV
jgi:hypothetical protein